MRYHLNNRRAFTLIELLVTMGLIVVLLSIAVAVSNSSAVDSYKLVGSADRVGQALLTAKSRALRDKAPRGIRFNVGADGYIRELITIESGEPWLPDQTEYLEGNTAINPLRSQFVIKYLAAAGTSGTYAKPVSTNCHAYLILNNNANSNRANGTQRGDSDYQRFDREVSIGDTVYSPDLGAGVVVNQKTYSFPPTTPLDSAEVPAGFVVVDLGVQSMTNPDLAAGFTNAAEPTLNVQKRGTFQTTQFGIHRSPRPIVGEPSMLLATNIAIDSVASLNVPVGTSFDVLFAPGGHVMNMSSGVVALTVRDTFKFVPTLPASPANWLTDTTNGSANFRKAGEMVLVAIYPKTGTVATKPVAEPTAASPDPYQFAKDAINSGL